MDYIANLKKEFEYYKSQKEDFVKKYNGKFISLKDHSVICVASNTEDAINETIKQGHEMGTFLIQHVSDKDEDNIQRFHSRVYC